MSTTFNSFICIALILISITSSGQQKRIEALKVKGHDETLFLRNNYLMSKPLFKKGLFFSLKGKYYKQCHIEMDLRFGISSSGDNATLSIDNLEGNTSPLIESVPWTNLNTDIVKSFLMRSISILNNNKPNTACIDNFINYYTQAILADEDYNLEFFTFHPSKKQQKSLLGDFTKKPMILQKAKTQSKSYAIYPPGATEGGTWTINNSSDMEILNGGTLFLPKNFTIYVDPDIIDRLEWTFDKVKFEDGATIDLSQRRTVYNKLPTPIPNNTTWFKLDCPDGNTRVVSCINGVCDYGGSGLAGISAIPSRIGYSGKNFQLYTKFIANTGTLWIRTDGSDGQDGQDGGNGGYGARGACGSAIFGTKIDGGNGGPGGLAADGGNGGNEAYARIEWLNDDGTLHFSVGNLPSPSPQTYSPSARPMFSPGQLIIISGNPGRGGKPGNGGKGGERGHGCNCGFLNSDAHDGVNGKTQPNGKSGKNGTYYIK